uniref:Si:dkey-172h23.2 n=1 Tax=Salarias fasciatus TaxID=181472 RepID=A0A672FVP9_SALFA
LFLLPVRLPLQGHCVITVQLTDEELSADSEGVDYFLLFAGSTQRHLTSTLRSSHDTLQALCPAHDCCEVVSVTLCSVTRGIPEGEESPPGRVAPLAEHRFSFVQDLAFDMAQFLVSTAGRADGLDGALMLDECQIPLQECERLDENLALALHHLTLPPGWSLLGNKRTNSTDPNPQETLLHFSARRGLLRVTRFLLRQPGAREALRLVNRQGDTPSSIAASRGNEDLCKVLANNPVGFPLGKAHGDAPFFFCIPQGVSVLELQFDSLHAAAECCDGVEERFTCLGPSQQPQCLVAATEGSGVENVPPRSDSTESCGDGETGAAEEDLTSPESIFTSEVTPQEHGLGPPEDWVCLSSNAGGEHCQTEEEEEKEKEEEGKEQPVVSTQSLSLCDRSEAEQSEAKGESLTVGILPPTDCDKQAEETDRGETVIREEQEAEKGEDRTEKETEDTTAERREEEEEKKEEEEEEEVETNSETAGLITTSGDTKAPVMGQSLSSECSETSDGSDSDVNAEGARKRQKSKEDTESFSQEACDGLSEEKEEAGREELTESSSHPGDLPNPALIDSDDVMKETDSAVPPLLIEGLHEGEPPPDINSPEQNQETAGRDYAAEQQRGLAPQTSCHSGNCSEAASREARDGEDAAETSGYTNTDLPADESNSTADCRTSGDFLPDTESERLNCEEMLMKGGAEQESGATHGTSSDEDGSFRSVGSSTTEIYHPTQEDGTVEGSDCLQATTVESSNSKPNESDDNFLSVDGELPLEPGTVSAATQCDQDGTEPDSLQTMEALSTEGMEELTPEPSKEDVSLEPAVSESEDTHINESEAGESSHSDLGVAIEPSVPEEIKAIGVVEEDIQLIEQSDTSAVVAAEESGNVQYVPQQPKQDSSEMTPDEKPVSDVDPASSNTEASSEPLFIFPRFIVKTIIIIHNSIPEEGSQTQGPVTAGLDSSGGGGGGGGAAGDAEEEAKDRVTEVPRRSCVLRNSVRSVSPLRRHSWGPGKNHGGDAEMNQRSLIVSLTCNWMFERKKKKKAKKKREKDKEGKEKDKKSVNGHVFTPLCSNQAAQCSQCNKAFNNKEAFYCSCEYRHFSARLFLCPSFPVSPPDQSACLVTHSSTHYGVISGTEMMDGQLMGEFEADSKEMEADSWSLGVEQQYLQQLDRELVKRQDVIYELMQTEMHHIRTLRIMSEVYSKGLQKEVQLEQQTVERLFPALDELLELHTQHLLRLLERKKESQLEAGGVEGGFIISRIGDILVSQFSGSNGETMKKVYGRFCSRHNEAVNFYKDLLTKDKRFKAFIKKKMSSSIVRRLGIPECILLVTQRITKYPVLIQRMLQHTKESEEDYDDLTEAVRLVKEVIASVDSKVNEHDKRRRLREFHSRMDSKSIMMMKSGQIFAREDLLRRRLIHDGALQLKNVQGRLKDVHALLLSDVFVFLQEKDQKYVFAMLDQRSTVISLQKLIVREVANEERGLFLITAGIEKPEMVEVLASSKDERNTWMQLIQEAMQSMEKDEDEGIPSETEDDKRQLETKAKEMRDMLRQKDTEIMSLLEEKVRLFRGMWEGLNPGEEACRQLEPFFRSASGPEPPRGAAIMKDALQEVETLQALVNGSLGGAMASVQETAAGGGGGGGGCAGPVCLPRRAETFGGFDSHQMHSSKSESDEMAGDLRRTESDSVLKKVCISILVSNKEVCVIGNRPPLPSQAVVVQQDSFIEDQRQALSERSSSCSSLSRASSRPSSLIEQEKQRSLEKQRQELASLQRQQAAHAEEKRRREREWELREQRLSEREGLLHRQEEDVRKQHRDLEEEKQELQSRKEEYQKDLERLRDAQRKLERDREAVQRQLDRMEELRVSEVTRLPTALPLVAPPPSNLPSLPPEDFLHHPQRSKTKGKGLNPFTSSSGSLKGGEANNQLSKGLLQLAKNKSKEGKEKKKKKSKGGNAQTAGRERSVSYCQSDALRGGGERSPFSQAEIIFLP